jgi:NAD(P)-dependent dehydrogenase (short-subunit alcohol dehydrogenase family)
MSAEDHDHSTAPATAGRLAGRRALITGAAVGIGREIGRRFVQEGASVALLDLDDKAVRQLGSELGPSCVATLGADVTDAGAVEAAVASASDALGGLDTVVNNAGIPMVGAVHELDEADWDRVLAVDLKSVYLVGRAAWPRLERAGGGTITNTASVAGISGTPGQAGYAAAKAATIMLTKCMALDGAESGIRVNCVCPGFTSTPMLEQYLEAQEDPHEARRAVTEMHPLGRLGDPLDIADAFVYLTSGEARWVTGVALVVDGGATAGI